MGKRRHKDKKSHLREKIRRLEDRLRRRESYSSASDNDDDYYRRYDSGSPPPPPYYRREYSSPPSHERIYELDSENSELEQLRSVAVSVCESHSGKDVVVETQQESAAQTTAVDNTLSVPLTSELNSSAGTSNNTNNCLPEDILEALGDPKGKEEIFGPAIPEEISKRWGRVLVDGLAKEQKQEMMEKTLIPENFRLVKAPMLNPEIAPVLREAVRNRDKLLEKTQNHLGLGIAALTNLTSAVIQGDLNKLDILKKLSEVSQILLDLHHENTKTRRKLVITSLDKKFTDIIKDVKRDSYLFGDGLGEKIKASKTAERSGLHIKRNDGASSSRKFSNQGNWKGPPKGLQGQRAYKQSGAKNQHYFQSNKRPPLPAADRSAAAARTNAKTRKQ